MKKASEPLYLSAREAAGELAVSPATLYAYVSRGLIRSEPSEDARARRYRADDVRALLARRAPAGLASAGETEAPVLDSAISTITSEGSVYRGVQAVALAEHATLEQAATLLWDMNDADPFAAANMPVISDTMRAVASVTTGEAPIPRAIAMLALAGGNDSRAFNRSRQGRVEVGARAVRLLTSGILGTTPSPAPIHLQVANAWAPGHPSAEAIFRRALVLLADHEFNPSTWTVRCAASTGINLYDALISGLVALKGPRHGGAGPLAAHMVADFAATDVAANIRERVAIGDRIPGFGHTVYRDGDPRADSLLTALAEAGADRRLAVEAPTLITEATGLHPNIDYALAVMVRTFGLPIGHETAFFAIARSIGWVAHAIEQLTSGVLIRPRARYVGPALGRGGS
ncbi:MULTISPECIES: citrate synthase family protein [Aminobacter]|jgi:citrate synthase|uniref:citrate synthase (unknown stereospecificity) n=1 Tax=Aminobacter ciceronei TaxID=150723 RepID=A0ABR6BZQ9_9HYPH|nr:MULTISPECIES: citrate synthase family protein [Aminobacter]WMC95418.1 citrate synthase family protein [Aminobacter aminovorans]MBA8904425.1 citrate synthase [Aminobacter ciceronei]MBA9018203.1 citrate synthase [Aminobacter ciceronei]MRX33139.1 citrate synthase [Aminobacter sp. MDW-2]QNH36767.1 citrate synthase family protein [Aminobacter sp. MDW-2]